MPARDLPASGPPASVRPLTGADSFWLRMDDPTNLMMINGVMLFDQPLDPGRVRAVLDRRLAPIRRFRERVVIPRRGLPRWEPYRAFDIDDHLKRERLRQPADDAVLRDLVSEKMSQPLDFARPLWQFHLVENYRNGSALIGRFHHCMGDGMGLMMVLLSMTDGQGVEKDAAGGDAGGPDNPFLALFHKTGSGIEAIRSRLDEIMPDGMKLLLKPVEALEALDGWKKGAAVAAALARLTFRGSDRGKAFKAAPGVPKRAAWSEPIPLTDARDVSHRLGATLNDVLLAAMAGGIRRYLLERGGESLCRDFRAMVPVNLRPLEDLFDLGNEFGLVYLSIPLEVADPLERLAELRRRMSALKRSAESIVTSRLVRLVGRMPARTQRLLVRLFASKATAVMTNVPGPDRTLYLAGKPIRDMFFWVPRSGRLGMGISILSYAGRVRMGVATDAGVAPDPERIVDGFHREFVAMRELVNRVSGVGA